MSPTKYDEAPDEEQVPSLASIDTDVRCLFDSLSVFLRIVLLMSLFKCTEVDSFLASFLCMHSL